MATMKRSKSVDQYILEHPEWADELIFLREIVKLEGAVETIKWGAPCYTIRGKNVIGIGAFKSYVGLWFYNGALLKDHEKVLLNAQEGVTKALRQWRFNSIDEMNKTLIAKYVKEAINNQKAGKEIKPSRQKKELNIPNELQQAFDTDQDLRPAFETFPPYKKREFADYITQAKREETRMNRLKKVIGLIKGKEGLSDKYR